MIPSTIPLLISSPVRQGSASLELNIPGAEPIPLGGPNHPINAFNPGWRAHALFTLLDPLFVLVLCHEDGTYAPWFIERNGTLIASPEHRENSVRVENERRLAEIVIWMRMAPGAPIKAPMPPGVEAYLALPREIRETLDIAAGWSGHPDLRPSVLADNARSEAATRPIPSPVETETIDCPIAGARHVLIGNPNALIPLVNGGGELAELGPGWRIDAVETSTSPVLCLPLSHTNGTRATWFVGLDGRMLSHAVELLPPELTLLVGRRLQPVTSIMFDHFVRGLQAVDLGGNINHLPPHELTFLSCAVTKPGETIAWSLSEQPPPGTAYVVPTDYGLHPLSVTHVQNALSCSLHDEAKRLLFESHMCWYSPFDGTSIKSDGFALLLAPDCFAYRFRHEAFGASFLVICNGTHFFNRAIWFAEADLLVALNPEDLLACRPWFAEARRNLLRHVLDHVEPLSTGANLAVDPGVQLYFGTSREHIGHYIWQDLSGLAFLLREHGIRGSTLRLHLSGSKNYQSFFGPEEEIFPSLIGHIERHDSNFFTCAANFYAANQRVIRYTSTTVPTELGPAVLSAVNAANSREAGAADAMRDAAKTNGAPIVLLGLRVGNRFIENQADLLSKIISRLAREFPNCAVIVDGLNNHRDQGSVSHPEEAISPEVAAELRLADILASVARENGVRFRSNINRSASVSAVWCARADAFFAPWGAALAKYRWICNTPGYVVTSRWNLIHRRDLHIYDHHAAIEHPSEMLFNTQETAIDLNPEHDVGGFDGRGSFFIKADPVISEFISFIARHVDFPLRV